jgi:hypothetical protein
VSEAILKHSRPPRKAGKPCPPLPERTLSVAKQPLKAIAQERRNEIAGEVMGRYLMGEQVADMAIEYETSDVTIYALLLREHEGEWKEVQTARALARLERFKNEVVEAKDAMRVAPDALSLARERDRAKACEILMRSAQWELERLLSRLYGQETNINISLSGDLGDRLRRARERVIDVQPVSTTQAIEDAKDGIRG